MEKITNENKSRKLFNERMFAFCRYCVKYKIQGCKSENAFWLKIEFSNSNIGQVSRNEQSFRLPHFMNACKYFGADANYFLKEDHFQMFMMEPNIEPVDRLLETSTLVKAQVLHLQALNAQLKAENMELQPEIKALKNKALNVKKDLEKSELSAKKRVNKTVTISKTK